MTFCLGIKTHEGLIALADTRLTSGTTTITAKKVTLHRHGSHPMFIMTSGLRSVRDKVLTYFDEALEEGEKEYTRLYQVVNLFAEQLRRVALEDKVALEESNFSFDLHALLGGEFEKDKEHRLYMVYPQGNWVEVSRATPYYIIGEASYGKPLLDRTLRYEDDLKKALKVAFLAFDATRTSANDVGYPIDVVTYISDVRRMHEHRFHQKELESLSDWWMKEIRQLVFNVPEPIVIDLMKRAFGAKQGRLLAVAASEEKQRKRRT